MEERESVTIAAMSVAPSGFSYAFRLTRREDEVLNHIRLGLTNRQIAERLFVSTNTVNKHVQQVLRKLEVSNRLQAAMYALRAPDRHNLS